MFTILSFQRSKPHCPRKRTVKKKVRRKNHFHLCGTLGAALVHLPFPQIHPHQRNVQTTLQQNVLNFSEKPKFEFSKIEKRAQFSFVEFLLEPCKQAHTSIYTLCVSAFQCTSGRRFRLFPVLKVQIQKPMDIVLRAKVFTERSRGHRNTLFPLNVA